MSLLHYKTFMPKIDHPQFPDMATIIAEYNNLCRSNECSAPLVCDLYCGDNAIGYMYIPMTYAMQRRRAIGWMPTCIRHLRLWHTATHGNLVMDMAASVALIMQP